MAFLNRSRPIVHGAARSATIPLIATALLAVIVPLAGCGGQNSSVRFLPGTTARINPIYDVTIFYPDTTLIVGGIPYHGVELDLEFEFDDATVRDDLAPYLADARLLSLRAGGVAHPYELFGPLEIEGTLDGQLFTTGLFGPIRVGTANLIPELIGELSIDRGRIEGDAGLFGTSERGLFTAVKRRRYLLAGSDLLSIGKVALVSVRYDTSFTIEHDLEVVSSDPIVRMEDGRAFVVNRLGFDNLQGLDPLSGLRTSFQYTMGNGANPHDLVVLPDEDGSAGGGGDGSGPPAIAFVTRYEPPYNDVAVIDLRDGALLDRIDLTPYARNPDRLPRPHQAILHEGLIYVSMQDADASFNRFENGRVVVIDPVLRDVIEVIDLEGRNPFQTLIHSRETGLLYVGLAGKFSNGRDPAELTGGVEAIDPMTHRSLGLIVDDDDLGGNVSAVAIASSTLGYCVITDASFRNLVIAFNPSTGEVLASVYESFNQIATIESDGDGYLLVTDSSSFQPRLIVLDEMTGIPVAFLPLRLPPFSVATITRSL
ncbi:MAG: hypothetical protein V3U83_00570 [Acidobacteriota bacterium]